ncbi:tRNA glutamyl-Q(34) synthetase GluQRS [Sphingorhabdus sp. 109]|jgi:glutamyl-Q tRNA(Asp) synthetase|uniref:tRNA glutamyl-Q(34) synthetase GluQRS n=1 Tax=Sphingorhabdus sp. 109 TaxID=2653173 RepID=UPI0012F228DA|nr:tRNA glutamyl-Q(34) synthetase GluQRS [Sphingorhabdus sp. 109]VWX61605.1 Glutamyl-Q tRNA(Asp) synthetase [Sphingorhabdus sp. 109]
MTSSGQLNRHIVVRFAPSPNGLLHLGHAYAAMVAHDFARKRAGRFLLRIEDIDSGRSRSEFVEAIENDLRWLGLDWDGDVIFQSERLASYAAAADRLKAMGLLYPCFCTRSDMRQLWEQGGRPEGPDGPVYAGTCRHLDPQVASKRAAQEPHSWRLDVAKAAAITGPLRWIDERQGERLTQPERLGDVILLPKDMPVAYHLAVTLDDARDGISHVVRGEDLFAATDIHRLLQALLALPTPIYFHHRLLLDDKGEKLSKSRGSASLSVLRAAGEDGYRLVQNLRAGIFPVGISLSQA